MIFSHPSPSSAPHAFPCKSAPLFSTTSTMLRPQPLSFQTFASLPGGGMGTPLIREVRENPRPTKFRTHFHFPYGVTPVFSHSLVPSGAEGSQNRRGVPQQFPNWNGPDWNVAEKEPAYLTAARSSRAAGVSFAAAAWERLPARRRRYLLRSSRFMSTISKAMSCAR